MGLMDPGQAAKVQMEAGQDLGGRWQTKNGVEC